MEQKNKEVTKVLVSDWLVILCVIIFFTFIIKFPLELIRKGFWCTGMLLFLIYYGINRVRIVSQENRIIIPNYLPVTSLVLLGEDRNVLKEWNINGKVGLLIGKNTNKYEVDIDLSDTIDAPFINEHHAILNYASGNWYIEGVTSQSEINVKKANGNKVLKINESKPVRIERGDIIYLYESALLLR